MKKLGLILIAFVTVAGCGGKLQQDPLKGSNPPPLSPKPQDPNVPVPGPADAIRPQVLDGYEFTVGVKKEITFDATVLEENYDLYVDILNLSLFPGASFDPATRVFSWTPDASVFSGELTKKITMEVVFIAQPNNLSDKKVVFRRDWPVDISVTRVPSQPEIVTWSTLPDYVQEDKVVNIQFTVKDMDAGQKVDEYPRLLVNGMAKGTALESYISIAKVEAIGNQNFRYTVALDLTKAEITTSLKDFELTFAPQSQFGVTGGSKVWAFSVFTSLVEPVITWPNMVQFKAGVETSYVFTVFDPRGEGTIELNSYDIDMPYGSKTKCDSQQNPSYLVCTLTWTPDTSLIGQMQTSFFSVNSSVYFSFRAQDSKDFNWYIKSEVIQ